MEKISCIIPAYNEERTVGRIVKTIVEAKESLGISEIIVVSDGSKDRTAEYSRDAGANIVLELQKNVGKAGAILEGIKKSSGQILIFLDADLLGLKKEHISSLINPILEDSADMVVGYLEGDELQNILPHLSGQRAIKRKFVEKLLSNKKVRKARYAWELLLTKEMKKARARVLYISLSGLTHLAKHQKYSRRASFWAKIQSLWGWLKFYQKQLLLIVILLIFLWVYLIFFSAIRIFPVFSELPAPRAGDRILVISSHPDDEIITAGGYLFEAVRLGAQVYVVLLTNGDANRFSAVILGETLRLRQEDLRKEGKLRMIESIEALNKVGVSERNIYFLGFPDKELQSLLKDNWNTAKVSKYTGFNRSLYDGSYRAGTPYTGHNLVELLREIILEVDPTILITHHQKDKNLDHVSTYKFVKIALGEIFGRELLQESPRLYTVLVHWKISEYPRPFRYQPDYPLYPPEDLKNECDWRVFSLSKEARDVKRQAIEAYKSQLESPYLRILLNSFIRTNELFCFEN